MRSELEIRADLDVAHGAAYSHRQGTPEEKAASQRVGALVRELSALQSLRPAQFTPEVYLANCDSFEQSAINRQMRLVEEARRAA